MSKIFENWKTILCCVFLGLLVCCNSCNSCSSDELDKTVLSNAIIDHTQGAYYNIKINSIEKSSTNELMYHIEFDYSCNGERHRRTASVLLFTNGVINKIFLNDDITDI